MAEEDEKDAKNFPDLSIEETVYELIKGIPCKRCTEEQKETRLDPRQRFCQVCGSTNSHYQESLLLSSEKYGSIQEAEAAECAIFHRTENATPQAPFCPICGSNLIRTA